MSTKPDTDLLDPEKMREAIAVVHYNQHMDGMRQSQSLGVTDLAQRAAYASETARDELHALNQRLLAAKVAWSKTQCDADQWQSILASERLLHEAFEALEVKHDT